MDWCAAAHELSLFTDQPTKRRRVPVRLPTCVVLDIEGTIAPIEFVTQTLFPYAKVNARSFLESTYDSPETQEAIKMLTHQADQVCRSLLSTLCILTCGLPVLG